MSENVLDQLIELSNWLGGPELDAAILGEGNTSAKIDSESFWVKASGTQLSTLNAFGLVKVRFERLMEMLKKDFGGDKVAEDEAVKVGLQEAKANPEDPRPSVETVLHALALQIEGVNFVGHTHPAAWNAILCSEGAEEAISGRLFPDEIVVCGPAPAFVPWTDPGLALARAFRDAVNAYIDEWGERPRLVHMQNHGIIALGETPQQVKNITQMAIKTARVLLGTYALGGPHFLSEKAVARIHTRPDEKYRQGKI